MFAILKDYGRQRHPFLSAIMLVLSQPQSLQITVYYTKGSEKGSTILMLTYIYCYFLQLILLFHFKKIFYTNTFCQIILS